MSASPTESVLGQLVGSFGVYLVGVNSWAQVSIYIVSWLRLS
jgi:hypothetical protein